MKISTDNIKIEEKLGELKKLLLENKAWFHPELTICCKNKAFSVEMPKGTDPEEFIMKIPDDLLIPLAELNLSVKDDSFFINPDKEKLSQAQINIATVMFEIFNLADKAKSFQKESPWITFRENPKLFDILLKARSLTDRMNFTHFFTGNMPGTMSVDEFVAFEFPRTRVVACKDKEQEILTPKFMPFIDYCDHHHEGAPYILDGRPEYTEDDGLIKIQSAQPLAPSNSCYANYGALDSLDTYLCYSFIYEDAPFVRSIPLEVPLKNMPGLIINSFIIKLPEPKEKELSHIKHYIPAINENNSPQYLLSSRLKKLLPFARKFQQGKQVVLSHLILSKNSTETRAILKKALEQSLGEQADKEVIKDRAVEAEKYIVAKNIEFYKDLIRKTKKDKHGPEELKEHVIKIATLQLGVLESISLES